MKKLEKIELIQMKNTTDEEFEIYNALSQFSNKISYPLLDVGSWSWKISSNAFWNKDVIHLDTIEFSDEDFKLVKNHKRIVWDFFNFNNDYKIKTILFCHSLQYLDDGWIWRVNDKIEEINPEYVLLVINKNDGILWELLNFFDKNKWNHNWEIHFSEFPWTNFSQIDKIWLTGNFLCKDINEVTNTMCRLLLDTTISDQQELLINSFLKNNWIEKNFQINQEVILYKNEKNTNE